MLKKSLIACAILAAASAQAHVAVEPASASAGAYQKLTFRVGHGCQGSATHTLTVVLPEAITGAKPMPKSGWVVSSANAREISWKGGPLLDAHFDEFALQVKLPALAGKHYFKVTQLCDQGRLDWVELPSAGAVLKSPAPMLEIVPAAAAAHHH